MWESNNSNEPIVVKYFLSSDFTNLSQIISDFLSANDSYQVSEGCIGVAGPVMKGIAKLTNIDWVVNEKELTKKFGFKLTIVNDMILHCYSIPVTKKEGMVTVCESRGKINDTMNLVIAPGTGLGQAFFVKTKNGISAFPSEASHREMSAYDREQQNFANYLISKNLSRDFDKILCGKGIELIYDFFSGANSHKPGLSLYKDTATIFEEALDDSNYLAMNCVNFFSRLLLDYCRELAVILLPFGGIYITGGIVQKNHEQLVDYFEEIQFRDNLTMKHLLEKIEVKFVIDDLAALKGAVYLLNSNRNS